MWPVSEQRTLSAVVLGRAQPRRVNVRLCVSNSLATGASVGNTAGAAMGTTGSAGTSVDTVVGAPTRHSQDVAAYKDDTKRKFGRGR